MRKIKQSEFIKRYCKRSKITEDKLNKFGRFAVLCDCGESICEGWVMVSKETVLDQIKYHT